MEIVAWPLALVLLDDDAAQLFLSLRLGRAGAGGVRPARRVLSGALRPVMNFVGLGLEPSYGVAHRARHPLQVAPDTLAPAYLVAIALFLRLARGLRETAPKAQKVPA